MNDETKKAIAAEHRTILSLAASESRKLEKGGISRSEANRLGYYTVAKNLFRECDPEEFRMTVLTNQAEIARAAINGNGNGDNDDDDDKEVGSKTRNNPQQKIKKCCELGFLPKSSICAALLGTETRYVRKVRVRLSPYYDFIETDNGYIVKSKKTLQEIEIEKLHKELEVISKRIRELQGQK